MTIQAVDSARPAAAADATSTGTDFSAIMNQMVGGLVSVVTPMLVNQTQTMFNQAKENADS